MSGVGQVVTEKLDRRVAARAQAVSLKGEPEFRKREIQKTGNLSV